MVGESVEVECVVDADGIEAGSYDGEISLTTNVPNNSSINIPVSLAVGKPTFVSDIPSGDFEELEFNTSSEVSISISNSGNMPLTVDASELSEPLAISDDLVLAEGEEGDITISMSCELNELEINETLELVTNDPYLESIEIDISAICVPTESPIIISSQDVPEDQGGYIVLEFTRSYFDDDGFRPSEYYTIERFEDFGTGTADWVGIFAQAAYADERYSVAVPTGLPVDSPEVSAEFRVVAAMDEGAYESNSIEGTSIDNLNPHVPEDIEGDHDDSQITLSWSYEQDSDFLHHRVEELCEDFYTIENIYVDDISDYEQYQVFSNDFSGNSSPSESVMSRELNYGNNLISFTVLPDPECSDLSDVFESIDNTVLGVIGEGVAAVPSPILGWVGSLDCIEPSKGYWVNASESDMLFVSGQDINASDHPIDLHYGQNLVGYSHSYLLDIGEGISSELEALTTGVIGEGVAAVPNPILGWVGSLSELEPTHGYWINLTDNFDGFTFNGCDSRECSNTVCEDLIAGRNSQEKVALEGFEYAQSMNQAFYFFESIELEGSEPDFNDYIVSYCNDQIVGYRQYSGPYTDVPAMGNDGQGNTEGYCLDGSIPRFKLVRDSGEIIELTGNIPVWRNNEIFIVESMSVSSSVPSEFSLSGAYPNPFNPSTTIDFSVPTESMVSISVYDISGRNIQTLVNDSYQPGYYSISWDGSGHSSGVYFVKMVSEDFIDTKKLMLIK